MLQKWAQFEIGSNNSLSFSRNLINDTSERKLTIGMNGQKTRVQWRHTRYIVLHKVLVCRETRVHDYSTSKLQGATMYTLLVTRRTGALLHLSLLDNVSLNRASGPLSSKAKVQEGPRPAGYKQVRCKRAPVGRAAGRPPLAGSVRRTNRWMIPRDHQ